MDLADSTTTTSSALARLERAGARSVVENADYSSSAGLLQGRSPFTSYQRGSSLLDDERRGTTRYSTAASRAGDPLATGDSAAGLSFQLDRSCPTSKYTTTGFSSRPLDKYSSYGVGGGGGDSNDLLDDLLAGRAASTDYKYEFLGDNNNNNNSASKGGINHTTTGNTTTTGASLFTSSSPDYLPGSAYSKLGSYGGALNTATTTTATTADILGRLGTTIGGGGGDSGYLTTLGKRVGARPTTSATSHNCAPQAQTPTQTQPQTQPQPHSTTTTTTTTTATTTVTSAARMLLDNELDLARQIEDTIDSIEIPARGRCRVFMAKYGYDPFKQSPNENPDAELALNAGDYVMVFDDIDEDGYFIGELMDGRRGYVPSNWLDRLAGEDLFEFQANILYKQSAGGGGEGGASGTGAAGQIAPKSYTGIQGDDFGLSLLDGAQQQQPSAAGYPPEFYDAILADTMNHSNFQHLLAPEDYHRMNDYVDLDDVDEVDDECLSDYERAEAEQMRRAVPPPQRLLLERQLNKCILIAWLHPQAPKGTIVSYQVYVDGVLKSTVPSGDRTKALLEGVDSNLPHRISVRALDLHGRHSNDAGCTIVVGQKIPFAPSCVKASHITSHSALISWLPCNSNFHHVVAVNSVEVQTLRPGVYKHLAQGLSANTLYRVWVRAKPGKILPIDEKNPKKLESLTTYVDFKTMPKSLPDPPVNVQVEAGPQRRTLLVTWLPLTLNDYGGSSNGCAVTGYAVFAGHKKLADIDSPTGDHALLDIGDLESLHKKSVTVRTKSGENLSQDSMPCQIPDEYLKAAGAAAAAGNARSAAARHHGGGGGSSSSPSRQRLQQQQQQQQHAHSGQSYSQQRNLARYAGGGAQQQARAAHAMHGQQQQRASRPLTRSLQNLESDLESRRSSIPAIEITRETSGSELMGGPHGPGQTTESFSEEEFENSMRLRGSHRGATGHLSRMSGGGGGGGSAAGGRGRFRARQSHSVDADHHHHHHHHHHSQQQQQHLLANNRAAFNQKMRGATPTTAATGQNLGPVRYFVALFDYDPSTMSPNPNAAQEELAFKEGSIIKIYGGLGEDGFYRGELVEGPAAGALGFVPCNVITEITDPGLLASLYERMGPQAAAAAGQTLSLVPGAGMTVAPQQLVASVSNPPLQGQVGVAGAMMNKQNPAQQQQAPVVLDPTQSQQQQQQQQQQQGGAVKRMVALYDYDPQENSPNADTESEIPFKTNDVIFVYGKMDTDGFYMGEVERTKQRGLVPSNFLREEPLPVTGGRAPMIGGGGGGGVVQQQQQPFLAGGGQQQNLAMQMQQPQQQQQQFNQQVAGQPMGGQFGANQQQMRGQPLAQQQPQPQNMIRGQLAGGPQQALQQQQQQQPQNVNRPNSLSLGGPQSQATGNQMMMNNPQQQQQQQLAMQMQQNGAMNNSNNQQQMMLQQQQLQGANKNLNAFGQPQQAGNQQFMGSNMMAGNQAQQQLQQQQQQQRNQQMNMQQAQLNQQQQQQGQGGVLGNLLTSGKQIINAAAATPRMSNQQQGAYGMQQPMNTMNQMAVGGGGGGGQSAMVPNASNSMMIMNQQQPQQQQNFGGGGLENRAMQQSAMNAFSQLGGQQQQQQPAGHLMDATNLQHQQQPMGGHNSFAMGGGNMMGANNQHQQAAFSNPGGGGGGGGLMGGGNFNSRVPPQMAGAGGPGGMSQMGAEEPGLLNTVKNILRL